MTNPLIGSTTAVFSIALSVALLEPVDVGWSTKDGTAKAGTDYEAASGVVTFLPGETSKQIQVTVYGQNVGANQPKNFYITLTPPSNAILNTPLVECVITVEDDQGTPITSLIVAQGKRGLKGDPGLSAYEQAVIMGYTGTINDWMNDIANASHAADRAEDALTEVEANAAKVEAAASAAAFAGRIFQTPAAGVDPITGVPNGYYYNVRSTVYGNYIDEYQNVDGVPTATGKSFPSSQFVQTISDYTALPFVAGKAYVINQRVQLANGDIVKNIVIGNTNNPNVDMTGWETQGNKSVAVPNDLTSIQNPKDGQVVYVESLQKNYIYNSANTYTPNGVTVISKWEMEVQESYYASWFCPPSSIDNVNAPQTDTINKAYRYATEKGRAFVIDHSYYVESIARKGTQAYPSLGGNDLLDYAIRVLSNSILIFKKGIGKLKLVPNNKTHSRVLCVFDVENYAIFDPECIGDKSTHLGTTGEQHYMIAFHASKNGYVRNPVCRNSWGDGLYFGYPEYVSIFNVDVDYPTNLVIDNPKIYNSSRNGISLCGAENLTVNSPLIDIVDRIAPMSGIDIEPEEDFVYSGKRMHLKNVKIHNLTVKNANNYGVMGFIVGNREIDVSFTGTTTFSAKAPYYCSLPIWHCSARGSDLTEAQYTASGAINFEKVVMSDAQAQWHIVAPIGFHSELGKIKLSIDDLTLTKHQAGAVGFGFDNPTSVTASWSGGLSVGKITLNGVDVVKLWGDNSASTPAKKLRYIDLPIPSYMQVGYESNKLQFENNVNIGGYARLNSKGWYNTNELINNTIFIPKANPGDGNSIQARIYDLGEISNGRTMVYSLESDLTTPQIGDGLYVHCGRLIRFTSPLSTATCEFQSNGLRKLKSSFGNFTIY